MDTQTLFRLEFLLGILNTCLRAVMLMIGAMVVECVECELFRPSASVCQKIYFGCDRAVRIKDVLYFPVLV